MFRLPVVIEEFGGGLQAQSSPISLGLFDALRLPFLGKLQLELTALKEGGKMRNLCMIDINDMKQ